MANALGGAACSDLDAGAPPFVLPSAPSAPLTLSAVEKTLSAAALRRALLRARPRPAPAPPASCATARAAARVAAGSVSLVSTLCEQIASERRRGDRLEESLRAAERELERRAGRLRELSDAADAWREALSERAAETARCADARGGPRRRRAGADHPPRRVATPPTVATPTPGAPAAPRAPSPQHASFACALRSPSPGGAAPRERRRPRAPSPLRRGGPREGPREGPLPRPTRALRDRVLVRERLRELLGVRASPAEGDAPSAAVVSRAAVASTPARFVPHPEAPPAFVSAFLRDPSDPSSDPVLDWDEACASLANALVARGVGEAAGVVVKRARRPARNNRRRVARPGAETRRRRRPSTLASTRTRRTAPAGTRFATTGSTRSWRWRGGTTPSSASVSSRGSGRLDERRVPATKTTTRETTTTKKKPRRRGRRTRGEGTRSAARWSPGYSSARPSSSARTSRRARLLPIAESLPRAAPRPGTRDGNTSRRRRSARRRPSRRERGGSTRGRRETPPTGAARGCTRGRARGAARRAACRSARSRAGGRPCAASALGRTRGAGREGLTRKKKSRRERAKKIGRADHDVARVP